MTNNNNVEYSLPTNAYASFDALTLKQLIINKLSENNVFKDQVYEGSNLSSLIDIIAFMYHVLLFQLNQNASEAVFTQATIYENMNKLVGLLNYKPSGLQTPLVEFSMTANAALPTDTYLIKKFTYTNVDGYNYSLIDDVSFAKALDNETENLSFTNTMLYQGTVTEYPTYTSTGENFETIIVAFQNLVNPNINQFVSDNSFKVFVKEIADNKWYEYSETSSLYLNLPGDRVFEKRFNENGRYEIRFGDNVNGKLLTAGSQVGIYFVLSDGTPGEVSANALANKQFLPFNTTRFLEIANDIYDQNVTQLQPSQFALITLDNEYPSTQSADGESVDQIRQNAPKLFSAQNRAVTLTDYKALLDKNFNFILASSEPVNNKYYVDNYIKYFYDLGLDKPNDDTGVLINQFNFMTSTNFNNIYLFMVPKFGTIRNETSPVSLSVAQKQLVVNELNKVKSGSHELVPLDPVYKGFSFGVLLPNEIPSTDIAKETFLVIKRSNLSKQSTEKIKNDVTNIVRNYFDINNCSLGQVIDITALSNSILSIEGVSSITTRRITNNTSFELPSISFVYWNPFYSQTDINVSAQNIPLKLFEFPYYYQQSLISNSIIVEDE